MYRNNVNINDLINRFEVTDDDFGMTDNVKYVTPTSFVRKYNRRQSGDENFGNDENRSLVKAYAGINKDKFVDNTVFIRRTNMTMSGVKEFIKQLLLRISMLLEMISKFPFPRMSVMSFGLTSLLAIFIAPRSFTEKVLYPGFKILFTIVYPAYRSFKAVRNKNLKEYLKWIVFWIVYAFFTCFELVSDALLNWFPFYYEIKVVFLIWLLGPSSRGSMKMYKNIIHPMLISREQEIDDIIQLAQDHGYMQVFRLSSKSVNYANRIIMQDAKTDSSFIVSHQLMKNVSLSNLSDVGTIQSNDGDDIMHMRRFSIENMPTYSNSQINYSYENLDSRRRPSYDYKYDDVMSSGYSSPTYQRYPMRQHQQKGAFIEENVRTEATQKTPETNQIFEQPSGKASIKELTNDEIILAYQKLQMEKNSEKAEEAKEDVMKTDENYLEFLKWMENKRNNEKVADLSSIKENILPQATPLHQVVQKVKTNSDDFNVTSCLDEKSSKIDEVSDIECEKPNVSGLVVSKSEDLVEIKDVKDVNVLIANTQPETDKIDTTREEEVFLDEKQKTVENEKTESDQEIDFNEFKDVISESDEEIDFLKVPLVIKEENETEETKDCEKEIGDEIQLTEAIIPTVVEEKIDTESNTINAKMTLTNDPLEIVTKLSSSSISLASSIDGNDNKIKRPAKHSKGRAPLPPAASTSTPNVIEGYFHDDLTKKHFKETEL